VQLDREVFTATIFVGELIDLCPALPVLEYATGVLAPEFPECHEQHMLYYEHVSNEATRRLPISRIYRSELQANLVRRPRSYLKPFATVVFPKRMLSFRLGPREPL
jgi:hypothetical protein